jgi:predicted nucleic acid-binding protein
MDQIPASPSVVFGPPGLPGERLLQLEGALDSVEARQLEEASAEAEEVKPAGCFLDTNVLVYAASLRAPLHQRAVEELRKRYASKQDLWISRQVLREYLATLTRAQTYSNPKPLRELSGDVRYFQSRFLVANEGPAVTEKLLDLIEQTETGGKQIHDANIVATMLVHGVSELLTNNPGDFARYSGVIRIIPLEGRQDDGHSG